MLASSDRSRGQISARSSRGPPPSRLGAAIYISDRVNAAAPGREACRGGEEPIKPWVSSVTARRKPERASTRDQGLARPPAIPLMTSVHERRAENSPDTTKRYGETLAVDGIAFAVGAGQTVGLLGGNGAGKTTTHRDAARALIPTTGTIRVLGYDMARRRFAALARMNFSSPYVSLPHRLSVGGVPRIYGHLYTCQLRTADPGTRSRALPRPISSTVPPGAVGRTEDPRRSGQIAD